MAPRAGDYFHAAFAQLILCLCRSRPECKRAFRLRPRAGSAPSGVPSPACATQFRGAPAAFAVRDFPAPTAKVSEHFRRSPSASQSKAASPENPPRPIAWRAPPSQCSPVLKSSPPEWPRPHSSNLPTVSGHRVRASPRPTKSNRIAPTSQAPARTEPNRKLSLHSRPDEMREKVKPACSDRRPQPIDGRCSSYELDSRSEEHTSELQSLRHLVCRL